MCELKQEAQTKIDRLIAAVERLAVAVEAQSAPPAYVSGGIAQANDWQYGLDALRSQRSRLRG